MSADGERIELAPSLLRLLDEANGLSADECDYREVIRFILSLPSDPSTGFGEHVYVI